MLLSWAAGLRRSRPPSIWRGRATPSWCLKLSGSGGGSGRNGGFVGPGYATSHANIARMVGPERAQALHRLSIEGVSIVEGNIDSLGMTDNKCIYSKMSVLRYHDPDGLARQCEMMKEFDYDLEVMSAEAVRDVLRSPKYYQALYDPASFHFHPLNYARSLAKAIEGARQ